MAKNPDHHPRWPALLAALLLAALLPMPCPADEPPAGEALPAGEPAAAESAPEGDPTARLFVNSCSGCHAIGGPQRSAPDLRAVLPWDRDTLATSVKRMEQYAGPLSADDVERLVTFLKDSSAGERIAAEEQRQATIAAATLEPVSVSRGRALYFGQTRLANGGANCASCHAVGGRGGNFAADLTRVHARYGTTALVSAIEQSGFPVMKPMYAKRPITKQEAAHLAAYLEAAAAGDVASIKPPRLMPAAIGLSVVLFALLAGTAAKRRIGTRANLVREANRR